MCEIPGQARSRSFSFDLSGCPQRVLPGFTVSVGKTEISVLFSVFATHREANFGPENR